MRALEVKHPLPANVKDAVESFFDRNGRRGRLIVGVLDALWGCRRICAGPNGRDGAKIHGVESDSGVKSQGDQKHSKVGFIENPFPSFCAQSMSGIPTGFQNENLLLLMHYFRYFLRRHFKTSSSGLELNLSMMPSSKSSESNSKS